MVRKVSRKTSCPSGKIKRASYVRKVSRKKSVKVGSTCVPAKGKAISRGAKTPAKERILPKIGKEIELGKFGYSVYKSETVRRKALRDASKKHGDLIVLRHLVLIHNYQAERNVKAIMKLDVQYLKERYAKKK